MQRSYVTKLNSCTFVRMAS